MSYEDEVKAITKHPPPIKDNSDEDTETQPQTKLFNQQAFGPWSTLDPKVKSHMVRTNISSGSNRSKFQGTYPPAPTIAQSKTAITGGFEFTINVVAARSVAGYNVYTSTVNNPAIAKLLKPVAQPQTNLTSNTIKIQDITAGSPIYWVASVNSAGKESARIPVAGSPAPSSIRNQSPGGGSGFGSGGGTGKAGVMGYKLA